MKKYIILSAMAIIAWAANAQQKTSTQTVRQFTQVEKHHEAKSEISKMARQYVSQTMASSANKRATFLLDSVETYSYKGADSTLAGNRFFKYDKADNLNDDASYLIDEFGKVEGDERTSYERGQGYYAEITHFWDQAKRDWDFSEKVEIRANLTRGDTLYRRLEYTWNTFTDKWVGFKAQAILDKKAAGGVYNLFFTLNFDQGLNDWVFETLDSSFTDAKGNVTHHKKQTWDVANMRWNLDEETKSTFKTRTNNRTRITETWNEDSSKYILSDSFVFKYVQDTILESGYYFGLNDSNDFDTLSYLTSQVNASKDTVLQIYFQRDSTGMFVPYLSRMFAIDGNGDLVGFEEMNLEFDEGIQKQEIIRNGKNETIIDFIWSDGDEEWIMNEKQEYEYNTKNYLTLNSFYSFDIVLKKWIGVEKRTYFFKADNETVLNRTNYTWEATTESWINKEKADFSYDADNDIILIVRSVYEPTSFTWVLDEKDFFYYGSWKVGMVDHSLLNIQVYPNPATNHIQFSQQLTSVQVFSASGQVVAQSNNTQSIDISNLTAGVYQVVGTNNGQAVKARFIKQ